MLEYSLWLLLYFYGLKNDVVTIFSTMPKKQIVPFITATVAVYLLKVAVIAGMFLLIKWVIKKIKSEKKVIVNCEMR